MKLQKEIERLEKDNRELRKNMMLRDQKNVKKRKMKVRRVLTSGHTLEL